MMVKVVGTRDSVAEIGEHFAWLGAALRSSPFDSGITYCTASIEKLPSRTETSKITFKVSKADDLYETSNGQCWQSMFRNPVIAKGFPITNRDSVPGLEIPLYMMAGLIEASHVINFNNRVILKSFCAMLVPTKRIGNILLWHFIMNEDCSLISYYDNRIQTAEDPSIKGLDISTLETLRHIVGWTSKVLNLAGRHRPPYFHLLSTILLHSYCTLKELPMF